MTFPSYIQKTYKTLTPQSWEMEMPSIHSQCVILKTESSLMFALGGMPEVLQGNLLLPNDELEFL